MKRKALALLVSLVLVVGIALPGTLAVSHDSTGAEETVHSQECEHCHSIGTHTPGCPHYVAPVTTETEEPNDGSDEKQQQEDSQQCPNCGYVGYPHDCTQTKDGGEQPQTGGEKSCTCNVALEEHLLCCPLHVKDVPGTLCPECQQNAGHLENCETGKQPVVKPSCTCNVAKCHHAASCPLWTEGTPAFCEECGLSTGHLSECSHYVPPMSRGTAPETEKPEDTDKCSCGSKNHVHDASCPLCGSVGSIPAHTVEGCDKNCTGTNCACACHHAPLFWSAMECTTLEELMPLLEDASEEERMTLTQEEIDWINLYIKELEPEFVSIEDTKEPLVRGEILYPTVSFTTAAPFGAPVTGNA